MNNSITETKNNIIPVICAMTVAFTTSAFAQSVGSGKKNTNMAPYPLGNPIIRHMYTADAAPHVMPDGQVWMVTSVDSESGGGYETMHEYHAFSSPDMAHWTDHGQILSVDDVRPADAPAADKWALWAPDMIYRNGKYYLYFPVRVLHSDQTNANGGRVVTAYIAVATSDSPGKRFKVINPKLAGTQGIDPAVFVDDDGQPYLYWGSSMGGKLADDMTKLEGKAVKLDVDTDRFMEASWMDKQNGRYYLSYHTKYDWKIKITKENADDPERKKSELAYSVGESPLGPFKYGGLLNYELGVNVKDGPRSPDGDFVPWRLTQSNHGGIVEFHGQNYLFYHTSALSSWRQDSFKGPGTWTQRSVCVDKLDYAPDGKVIPVQQTIDGVSPVVVRQPYEIKLAGSNAVEQTGDARKAGQGIVISGLTATVRFTDVNLGTGYYWFGCNYDGNADGLRMETRLDGADGLLLGTALPRYDAAKNGRQAETFLRNASGKHDIFILIHRAPTATGELNLSGLRFFAGAPEPGML
jgi:hypothetical protein